MTSSRFLPAALLACALPACTLPLSAPASAAPSAMQTQSTIHGLYEQINAAFQRRDVGGVMAYFTPDYTATDPNGDRLSRDQTRRRYQDQLGQIKTIQGRFTIRRFVPTPGGAWAEMQMHTDGTGEKRILFAHVRGTFTNDFHSRDLWVKTPQGWRLKYRQILQDDTRTHRG